MGDGNSTRELPALGWREWISLPDLGVSRIKAKIDTGARSSALHADDIERFARDGAPWLRFVLRTEQRVRDYAIPAEARMIDERVVRSSNGRSELRPVIRTTCVWSEQRWAIDVTLTSRDVMGFRMLIGRASIRGRYLVDPGRSYVGGVLPSPIEQKPTKRMRDEEEREKL